MAVVIASAALRDEEFLAAVQMCSLPLQNFRHGDHLRFAWLQLERYTLEEASRNVETGIMRFARHHGASHIFHRTLTIAWVKLLGTHHEDTFEEFIQTNEARLTRELLYRFWTPSALDSAVARSSWLPPDRQPLPE